MAEMVQTGESDARVIKICFASVWGFHLMGADAKTIATRLRLWHTCVTMINKSFCAKSSVAGLLGLLALPFFARPLAAQPLESDPYHYASPANGPAWYTVNSEAWDSFASFDTTRMFGKGSQQDFTVGVDYVSRPILYGKKAGGASMVPEFTWVSPLFGGEGYSSVTGTLPLHSPYAEELDATGGWRYHLMEWTDIDIGGNLLFYNKSVQGSGLPATWGTKSAGDIYVGFTGRVISHPAIYFSYDPTFGRSILSGRLSHVLDLGDLLGVKGLYLGGKLEVGVLEADVYNGGNKVAGQNWRNGYAFFEASLDVDYEVYHGVFLRIGGTWGVNNDGSGSNGIAGTNLGPDDNLSFHGGIMYSF